MATAPEFRSELHRRFREATTAGRSIIDIVARDLHGAVQQINPTPTQRYPNCCSVMRQEQRVGIDEIISERANDGANFAIRYRLSR
jgi:hypothetical protein